MSESNRGDETTAAASAAVGELTHSQAELVERMRWLILLRWLAFAGVVCTILVARILFQSSLPWHWLLLTALTIPVYNLVCYLAWRRASRAESKHIDRASALLANAQILCDLLVLGALIHFSGGVENTFCVYFVFHMVIASILLSRRAAFAQATAAVIIFGAVVAGEYFGVLVHYTSPVGISSPGLERNSMYVLAELWALTTLLYVTVYLATSITARLRWRESQVASLSRQTACDAEDLRAAYDKLAETEKAKSAYAMTVAHELRSPLAAIESLLRAVSDGLQGEVSEQALELIDRARNRVRGLLALVRDLLALASARESTRSVLREQVDLRAVLEGVIHLLEVQAESRRILVNTHVAGGNLTVRGNQEQIEELLTNLISNAIKYSSEGGAVDVTMEETEGAVEIQVADSGIGIPEEEMPHIFDDFYRAANARAVTSEGTGLGLSVVKSVVEAHGGTISVSSRPGVGTRFAVRLPANEPSDQTPES